MLPSTVPLIVDGRAAPRWLHLQYACFALLIGCTSPSPEDGHPPTINRGGGEEQSTAELDILLDREFGRIVDVAVDRFGRMFVADQQNSVIYVFSEHGEDLSPLGGRGSGPGEFEVLEDLTIGRGDTLFVFDSGTQRVTVYSINAEPRLQYTVSVHQAGLRAKYKVLVPPGEGLILPYAAPLSSGGPEAVPRLELRYLRGADGAESSRTVATVNDQDGLITTDERYGFAVSEMPFGVGPVFEMVPTGDGILLGHTGSEILQVIDFSGRTRDTISLGLQRYPVGNEDIQVLLQQYATSADPFAGVMQDIYGTAQEGGLLPKLKPAFDQLLVGTAGDLWVRVISNEGLTIGPGGLEYDARPTAGGDMVVTWLARISAGCWMTLQVPANIELKAIARPYLYGVRTDELGVERPARLLLSHEPSCHAG